MEPNQKLKTSAKDFFLNLGAFVALYVVVVYVLQLLFTVIDAAYPLITSGYNYSGSQSISWPVATLIIFFPIFIFLQWFLAREFTREPERKNVSVRKWLTYITLFLSGLTLAIDLVTVLYSFIDGQELTTGFLLKVLMVFIVALSVFLYYIADVRGKLTNTSRMVWRVVALVIVLGSIVWGFAVLGSPRTQQLLKYDEQKVSDLQNINSDIQSYYQQKNVLPLEIIDLVQNSSYMTVPAVDAQTNQPYEYIKMSDTSYELCAVFNKASDINNTMVAQYSYGQTWNHPAGRYCFLETLTPPQYPAPKPAM